MRRVAGNSIIDTVVIGSGPGGATAAALLAEGGRQVEVLEDGPAAGPDDAAPFTRGEMIRKYRNGGLTVAMGRARVAYVEACCVGGGSEINSGLYLRTPDEVVRAWQREFQIEQFSPEELAPRFADTERDLSVSPLPFPAPASSLRLHAGAQALNWKSEEVPRWYKYAAPGNGAAGHERQTMTRTFLRRAVAAGGRVRPQSRVIRLRRRGQGWSLDLATRDAAGNRRRELLLAHSVIVACGAIQTAALLQRSGIGQHVGKRLHLHPTVKVAARFAEPVNSETPGVGVHQVKQFAPRLSLGCSISSRPHLALTLLPHRHQITDFADAWRQMAVYCCASTAGSGQVRAIRGFRDPLVRFELGDSELAELAGGMRELCRCLLAAGATVLYPGVDGTQPVRSQRDLDRLPATLPAADANLMTVHLFSSCPMGERRDRCTADSFGRVHGEANLWIADGSLLPGPPGVNPQGSIMAIVRRNVQFMLGRL